MYKYLIGAGVVIAIFYGGYTMGGNSKELAYRGQTDAMRARLTTASDDLFKLKRALEAKNNEIERTIRNTIDHTGCNHTVAPSVILDSVR